MKASTNRLSYPCYRCHICRRVITRLQIVEKWEAGERELVASDGKNVSAGLCVCGSSRISPTNPTLVEELTTPAIWKLWWVEVARPWLEEKL